MKRLRRIILNGLTVLSVLVCAGTLVLWVRSYSVCDIVTWLRGRGWWIADSNSRIYGHFKDAPVSDGFVFWRRQTRIIVERGELGIAFRFWGQDWVSEEPKDQPG